MVYVVITALPRDALVEWQIVAVKKTKDDAFASYSETTFAGKLLTSPFFFY